MENTLKQARYAGILYLLIAVLSPIAMLYIPSQLIVSHDMTETARNIVSHQLLFRLGVGVEIAVCLLEILLSILLYQIFKKVSRLLSLTALAARLAMTVIQALNATIWLTVITSLISKGNEQIPLSTFLNFHDSGTIVWQFFFGLHLIALGILVYQSGYVHRFFGILLFLASLGYLIKSITILFSLNISWLVTVLLFFSTMGELAFTLRLLFKRIRLTAVN